MSLTKVSYSMIQGAPVNVLDFGAIGDGVANDTSAIQAALAALATKGGELFFPTGTYKVTAPISQAFADGINVKITGYGAKIDGTSVTGTVDGDTVLILLGGSTGSVFTKTFPSSALGANVSANATSITSASTFGVQPDDILLVTSTDLWNPTRPYYFKGEMVQVRGVSGTTIECSNGLFDGYTAATTTIFKLPMPYISVEGLEIEMNANQIGLAVHYARNATIRNVTVHGARWSCIQTFYCFGGIVDTCFTYDSWYVGTGSSYGVTVASNQNFSVTNCTSTQARHCITVGGFEPDRSIIIDGNHCIMHPSEPSTFAIDVHGSAEYVIISNNYTEGIICVGINASILGNTVRTTRAGSGINIRQEINSIYFNISDNYIEQSVAPTEGIWVSPVEDNLTINRLNILGNTIVTETQGILISPRDSGVTGSIILSCVVTGNIVSSNVGYAFLVNDQVGNAVTIKSLSTANNYFNSNAFQAYFIKSTTIIDTHLSVGDSYLGGVNNSAGVLCEFSGSDLKISNAFFNGYLAGSGANGRINYNNTGHIQVTNCTFDNLTWRASLLSAASTYIENGAIDNTVSTVIVNTPGAKVITNYDSSGKAVASLTAAPTTNTWARGDIVWNNTPTVGQPKGWMCTVAGTPGTWVSMGNL